MKNFVLLNLAIYLCVVVCIPVGMWYYARAILMLSNYLTRKYNMYVQYQYTKVHQ